MGSNPSHFQGDDNPPDSDEVQEKRPVEKVTWFDSIAFCNKLTKRVYGEDTEECLYYDPDDSTVYSVDDAIAEKVPLFDINSNKKGFRLPTEAEWEYAAKGGEDYTYSGSNNIDDVAWYKDNSNNKTHQVKKKNPNSYGLYDMSGNVWEWCFDSWDLSSQPAFGDNPVGKSWGYRIVRGGGWMNDLDFSYCASAYRSYGVPSDGYYYLGFRLAGRF